MTSAASMSRRPAEYVARCVPRQGGGWLVITTKGNSGVSQAEIATGARVVIRDGQAVRA